MTTSDDHELIERARGGDQTAARALYDRHAPYVVATLWGYAVPLNHNSRGEPILDRNEFLSLLEELTGAAFAAALKTFDSTKGSQFRTWIVWKARGRLEEIVEHRIRQRAEADLLRDVPDLRALSDAEADTYVPSPWRNSPESVYIAKEKHVELYSKIEAVLRALPVEEMRVLVLVYFHFGHLRNGAVKATAESTGRTVDSVQSLLRRAKHRFAGEWRSRFDRPEW